MNKWDELSMAEKNQLIGIYVSKGYRDLAAITAHYNSFAEGGLFGPGGPTGKKPRGVKKVAHQINIEGQQPAETPPSFEEYVTNHLTELQKSAARSEAQKRYAARYGRKYPFFPNNANIFLLYDSTPG